MGLPSIHSGLVMCVTLSASCLAAELSLAGGPHVAFDVAPVVICREVTTEAFAVAHPGEKVIEATFRVSARVVHGREEDIEQLLVRITSPERRMRVESFAPKTKYETQVDGSIEVTEQHGAKRSLGGGLSGGLSAPIGPVNAHITPSASVGKEQHRSITETYKKIPRRHAVLVSGTTDHGFGVFYKIKPSTQASLEGSETFSCHFVVPQDWQGDWVKVTCLARGTTKEKHGQSVKTSGQSLALVGLYMTGNQAARHAARRLAVSQVLAKDRAMKTKSRSELSALSDSIAKSFDSLACKIHLKKCKRKSHAGHRGAGPHASVASAKKVLAQLSGDSLVD